MNFISRSISVKEISYSSVREIPQDFFKNLIPADPLSPLPWIICDEYHLIKILIKECTDKLGIFANHSFLLRTQSIRAFFKIFSSLSTKQVPVVDEIRTLLFFYLQNLLEKDCPKNLKNILFDKKKDRDEHIFNLSFQLSRLFVEYSEYLPEMVRHWNHTGEVWEDDEKEKTQIIQKWQLSLWQGIYQKGDFVDAVAMLDHIKEYAINYPDEFKNKIKDYYLSKKLFYFSSFEPCPLLKEIFELLAQYEIESHIIYLNQFTTNSSTLLPSLIKHWFNALPKYFQNLKKLNSGESLKDISKNAKNILKNKFQNINFIKASSKMRQAQVIKDLCLNILNKKKKLPLGSIGVLFPNVSEFVPYLKIVFEGQEDQLPISYSISCVEDKDNSYLKSIEMFFDFCLKENDFSFEKIVLFLHHPCVLKSIDLNTKQLEIAIRYIRELHIHRYLDPFKKKDLEDWNGTWLQGELRFIRGCFFYDTTIDDLENLSDFSLENSFFEVVNNFSKESFIGNENSEKFKRKNYPLKTLSHLSSDSIESISKVFEYINGFRSDLIPLRKEEFYLEDWIEIFKLLISQYITTREDNKNDQKSQKSFLDALNNITRLAYLSKKKACPISLDSAVYFLKMQLNMSKQKLQVPSHYQVSCGDIHTLASVAFPYLILVGFDEGTWPRNHNKFHFDLIKEMKAKAHSMEEDRLNLFNVLAGAEKEINIIYNDKDIHSGIKKVPANQINELIEAYKLTPKELDLPIIPYDKKNFINKEQFSTSFNSIAREVANSNEKAIARNTFKSTSDKLSTNSATTSLEEYTNSTLDINELINFILNPAKHHIECSKIYLPYTIKPLTVLESESIDALSRNHFFSQYFKKEIFRGRIPDKKELSFLVENFFLGSSILGDGILGDFAKEEFIEKLMNIEEVFREEFYEKTSESFCLLPPSKLQEDYILPVTTLVEELNDIELEGQLNFLIKFLISKKIDKIAINGVIDYLLADDLPFDSSTYHFFLLSISRQWQHRDWIAMWLQSLLQMLVAPRKLIKLHWLVAPDSKIKMGENVIDGSNNFLQKRLALLVGLCYYNKERPLCYMAKFRNLSDENFVREYNKKNHSLIYDTERIWLDKIWPRDISIKTAQGILSPNLLWKTLGINFLPKKK